MYAGDGDIDRTFRTLLVTFALPSRGQVIVTCIESVNSYLLRHV